MKWIPLNEQQPEFEVPVLVKNEIDNEADIARLEGIRQSKNGTYYDFLEGRTSSDDYYKDVTHWMPLP